MRLKRQRTDRAVGDFSGERTIILQKLKTDTPSKHPANPVQIKEAEKAKKVILQCIADGLTVEQSCSVAGKSIKSYEYYRRSDPVFKSLVDRTRLGALEKNFTESTARNLDFVTWRKKYLKQETFGHQKNLIDVIEGRDPSWMHPSMKYEKGLAENRILLNIPPNHAKSITVTVDYVTYKIVITQTLEFS